MQITYNQLLPSTVHKEAGGEKVSRTFLPQLSTVGSLLVLRSAEQEYQLAESGRRKGNVRSCV